jgi:hypothetical protein
MCSVWAFLMVRQGRTFAAGMFAAGATAVKMPWLIILLPALCVEWMDIRGWRLWRQPWRLLLLVLPALCALSSWMAWQWVVFHDPFDFIRAQSGWTPGFTPLWSVVASYVSATVHDLGAGAGSAALVLRGLDLAALIGFFATSLYVLLRVRRSYGVFLLTGFLVINDAGGNYLSSELRFLVPFFPIFLAAALLVRNRPRLGRSALIVAVPLLLLFTGRFVAGGWAG